MAGGRLPPPECEVRVRWPHGEAGNFAVAGRPARKVRTRSRRASLSGAGGSAGRATPRCCPRGGSGPSTRQPGEREPGQPQRQTEDQQGWRIQGRAAGTGGKRRVAAADTAISPGARPGRGRSRTGAARAMACISQPREHRRQQHAAGGLLAVAAAAPQVPASQRHSCQVNQEPGRQAQQEAGEDQPGLGLAGIVDGVPSIPDQQYVPEIVPGSRGPRSQAWPAMPAIRPPCHQQRLQSRPASRRALRFGPRAGACQPTKESRHGDERLDPEGHSPQEPSTSGRKTAAAEGRACWLQERTWRRRQFQRQQGGQKHPGGRAGSGTIPRWTGRRPGARGRSPGGRHGSRPPAASGPAASRPRPGPPGPPSASPPNSSRRPGAEEAQARAFRAGCSRGRRGRRPRRRRTVRRTGPIR